MKRPIRKGEESIVFNGYGKFILHSPKSVDGKYDTIIEAVYYKDKDITVSLMDFFRKSNGFAFPYNVEKLSVAVGK